MKRSLLSVALAIAVSPAFASSHREAPLITEMPKADSTDFYMFRSYEPGRKDFVTLIANYVPFQDPWGGPNYYFLDPDARYEIHIDNDGDAIEDITFRFAFKNNLKSLTVPVNGQDVPVPLINIGPIAQVNADTLNIRETYQIEVITDGNRRQVMSNTQTQSTTFDKPVDNIGNKSIPDYATYAAQHVYDVKAQGCDTAGRVFVGQRKESFVINVGEIFDLINLSNPLGPENAEPNTLEDKNITTIAIEVPISCITKKGNPIIGGWQTASLRSGSNSAVTTGKNQASSGGNYRQVSRLGLPLVNEVVTGLKDKDKFNSSEPKNDAQFLQYVATPTLPELIEILFGAAGVQAPNNFPRNDLVATFLTGIQGLNQPPNVVPSEMQRLNTSIDPTPYASQNRLGVLGGDNAGFPNGRRLGDDVVDIELRVAMGVLCHAFPGVFCNPADAPSGNLAFTDGAFTDFSRFDAAFPYLRTPIPGSPNEKNGVLGQ